MNFSIFLLFHLFLLEPSSAYAAKSARFAFVGKPISNPSMLVGSVYECAVTFQVSRVLENSSDIYELSELSKVANGHLDLVFGSSQAEQCFSEFGNRDNNNQFVVLGRLHGDNMQLDTFAKVSDAKTVPSDMAELEKKYSKVFESKRKSRIFLMHTRMMLPQRRAVISTLRLQSDPTLNQCKSFKPQKSPPERMKELKTLVGRDVSFVPGGIEEWDHCLFTDPEMKSLVFLPEWVPPAMPLDDHIWVMDNYPAGRTDAIPVHEQPDLKSRVFNWVSMEDGAPDLTRADSSSLKNKIFDILIARKKGDWLEVGFMDFSHLYVKYGVRKLGWIRYDSRLGKLKAIDRSEKERETARIELYRSITHEPTYYLTLREVKMASGTIWAKIQFHKPSHEFDGPEVNKSDPMGWIPAISPLGKARLQVVEHIDGLGH